jgi:hypothetical protein
MQITLLTHIGSEYHYDDYLNSNVINYVTIWTLL